MMQAPLSGKRRTSAACRIGTAATCRKIPGQRFIDLLIY
jgi:hypothetical protein